MNSRSIEATVEVAEDGSSRLRLSEPLAPGSHRFWLLPRNGSEDATEPTDEGKVLLLPNYFDEDLPEATGWPQWLIWNREQLYAPEGELNRSGNNALARLCSTRTLPSTQSSAGLNFTWQCGLVWRTAATGVQAVHRRAEHS